MSTRDLSDVFARLHDIMAAHTVDLEVVRDEPGDLYVDTRHVRKDGYVFMFGAVQTKARYVSYHLPVVHVVPELRDGLSPALAKRMQGKSCFNFTRVDDGLFAELEAVTARAAALARDPAVYGV